MKASTKRYRRSISWTRLFDSAQGGACASGLSPRQKLPQTLPGLLLLTRQRPSLVFRFGVDLIDSPVIPYFVRQPADVRVPVPPGHVKAERQAAVNEQVHEIVIRVAPIYVPEVDDAGHGIVFHQHMILAEIGVED